MAEVTFTLPDAMKRAFAAYKRGRFDVAEVLCRAVLGVRADHFNALHLLALVQSRLEQKDEALANLDRALLVQPDHAEAHNNRGVILHAQKRYAEALAGYERALAVRPDNAEANFNRGNVLKDLAQFGDAIASYDRALAARPDYAEALNNRGIALQTIGRFDEALETYERALAVRPGDVGALTNRGNTLRVLERFEEALASFDRALELRPDYSVAHNNRGVVLKEMKRLDESLASYDRALELQPDYAEALNNRGNVLQELLRTDEALTCFERALAIRPDYVDAHNSRGVAFMAQKRLVEALASYEKAIALKPDDAQAHYNLAHCRLLMGDFDHGWRENEWRWQIAQARNSRRDFARPEWSGREEIAGKLILLHAEQGFGDTIQFCRYARLVKQRGAHVILQVQPALKRLMSGLPGADFVLARDEPLPPFELHCPLLSLPRAFGTRMATIPPMRPLSVPPELKPIWQSRLGPKVKPRVGIVWSGRPTHRHDRNRSISLRVLLGLLELPVQLVSLQKEVRSEDQAILGAEGSDILHFGPSLTDFSETAALTSLMDLVISVDTAVAHLAAALGRPTWILLPFIPDWRWMLDRMDTPWYPSARLFRQQRSGEWSDVIAPVATALAEFAAGTGEAEVPRGPDQIAVNRLSRG